MKVIYKIINVVNNKFYVGSATKFNRRKWSHISQLRAGCHANNYLQKAWDKYGEKSFVFVVVEEVSDSENLLEVENKWLKENVGRDLCYNIALDATAPTLGMTGEKATWRWGKKFPHNQEAKNKIGKSSKGRPQSEETRAKRIATMTGVTHTLERRMNLSKAVSGEKNPNYGKPRSEAFKEKVSRKVTMVSPDGEAVNYPSILALREATGLKPSTVNNGLKHGNPMRSGPYKGWRFENA
jgi:group I intron endonuclease